MQARRHVFKGGPAEVRASAEGTSGGEHEKGYAPSRKGGSPPRFFFKFMVASMCVLMHFGRNFSRLRLIWNRRHLHESIREH